MTMKRFINTSNNNFVVPIWDLKKECSYDLFEIMECLNALHEENTQLKERNEFLKKQLDRVCIDNEEMGDKLKKLEEYYRRNDE